MGDATPDAAARRHQAAIDELWDFDDPVASEVRLRAAADEAPEGVERELLVTQVARSVGLQGRYEEAFGILDRVPVDRDPELEVRRRLETGRALNSSGDGASARPLFESALAAAEAAGLEQLAVDAIHMAAIVALPEEQPALHARAIAMAEAASDPRAHQWLASLYNNAAWTRFEAGDHAGALEIFEKALQRRVEAGKPREIGIARWAVARTLRALGRTDEALAMQRALAATNAAAGVDDPYVDEEIGECLVTLGEAAEARPFLARAADGIAADPWMAANEPARIERLRRLAADPDGTNG